MFDLDHPFFRPLWLRALIVAICLVWAIVEFFAGAQLWGSIFAALGAYCIYRFFIVFAPRDEP